MIKPPRATIGRDPHQTRYSTCGSLLGNNKKRWSFPKQCHVSSTVLLHYPRSNSRCHMASMGSCTYLENLGPKDSWSCSGGGGGIILIPLQRILNRALYTRYMWYCPLLGHILPTSTYHLLSEPETSNTHTHTTSEWILRIFRSTFGMLNPPIV